MEFIKRNKNLLLLIFLSIICLFLSIGHYANIYIDVGREMYYPLEIIRGKVLYKDIFCIYGPLSYLINAFFYKILGAKLETLYFLGASCAILTVAFTYLIAKKFLSDFISFAISLFVIITGCLAVRIFNFTLPYSYAVTYGLLFFLISVYFLINFIEDKKNKNLYVSSLFCGLCLVCKYDFILYLIPFLIVLFKTKDIKLILKSSGIVLISALFPFLFLFIGGLKIEDLIQSFKMIVSFTNTNALDVFYSKQGVYYTKRLWGNWIKDIIFDLIFVLIIYSGLILKNKKNVLLKIFGVIVIVFGCLFTYFNTHETSYLFLTFAVLLFLIFGFKKNNFKENILILSALLTGIKSLWGLSHVNYGLYYAGSIFISFFIFMKNNFTPSLNKACGIVLIMMSLNFLTINIQGINIQNTEILTDRGRIKTRKESAELTNELIKFINGIENNSYVMIFPEGLNINFLGKNETKTAGFYNSLIPLYVEGFGDETITKYYKDNPPDYIVFLNTKMNDYGYDEICNSYAFKLCDFTKNNYRAVKKYESEKEKFIIFKKN